MPAERMRAVYWRWRLISAQPTGALGHGTHDLPTTQAPRSPPRAYTRTVFLVLVLRQFLLNSKRQFRYQRARKGCLSLEMKERYP